MAKLYGWDWEREYTLNPHPRTYQIPAGFEDIITSVREVKEFTIRAGSNRDNILKNFGDWMETIFNAIRVLLEINPRFERARITTSYYLLRESTNFFNQYTAISVREGITAMKEISDWGYSGTENVFIITDGLNVVKTEPVSVIRPPPVEIKKHEMDVKYPHVCFKCGKKLQYKHTEKQAEYKGVNMKEFDKLWESENVEFYCCSCYGKEVK